MPPKRPRKPVALGVGHPRRRARVLLVATLFVFSIFAAQLLRIQGFDAQRVSAKALDSRLHVSSIPAQRGSIVDANGTVLAASLDRVDIVGDATATVVYKKRVDGQVRTVGLAGAATDIANAIGAQPQPILTALQQAEKKKSQFTYLAKGVTPAQWKTVQALQIPGISSEAASERDYPQGTALAPLLGWVDASGQPGGGVEQMEQKTLNGTPGKHVYEQAPDGTMIATGDNKDKPAVDGKDVQLTINNDLQWYAQNALSQAVKKAGALSGEIVVMDPKQNLKAVASYPSFDNNNIGAATSGQLQSRPFTDAYEPGSTGKVITMSALLAEGKATPTSQVVVPPTLSRAGTTFHDAEVHGTENLTLAGVLAQSSNIGTMLAGSKLPSSTVYDYMRKFGLGQTSGTGYPGESDGVLSPFQKWSETQKYTVLYGQGVAATGIQEASIFATIANNGVREPIKLVSGIGENGTFTRPTDDRTSQQVVSSSVASQVTKMMEGVVSSDGTAKSALVPGYSIAGKTGTANRYDATLGRYDGYTASFIGFAPASNPRYVVAVTIQRPTKGSIFGGDVAAPVFSQVMSYALKNGGVPPSGKQAAPYPLTFQPASSRKP
ncbi:penicillin-binding protein 2 [Flexivirga sp. ID2601S]|uniref:Penicillin-binding protein 2 n=1 Tax=Flexivirga aerilata TaxID=1656889 RepID=A0A849ASC8_9MICO|nr:penicillin-binding protein 2 [Flexivirga aerilata]NNG39632.1 penicillin-binding protein 2 [Flexivirga aerilata]